MGDQESIHLIQFSNFVAGHCGALLKDAPSLSGGHPHQVIDVSWRL